MTTDVIQILNALREARDEQRRLGEYNNMLTCIHVIEEVLQENL